MPSPCFLQFLPDVAVSGPSCWKERAKEGKGEDRLNDGGGAMTSEASLPLLRRRRREAGSVGGGSGAIHK